MARLLLYVAISCALVIGSAAQCPVALADMGQNADEVFARPGTLISVEGMLTEMSIPLTDDCLLVALHSQNHEVRNLVAGEVAHQQIKQAIPVIEQLLANETKLHCRIQLASDLTVLGDQQGTKTLAGYCTNAAEPIWARLDAARGLQADLKQQSCPEVLIAALHERESSYRAQALQLIPHSIDLSATDFLQLHTLLLKSLSDQDRLVRIIAAQTVAKMNDVSAIPALQAALAGETDPDVRSAMNAGVKSLQSQQQ